MRLFSLFSAIQGIEAADPLYYRHRGTEVMALRRERRGTSL